MASKKPDPVETTMKELKPLFTVNDIASSVIHTYPDLCYNTPSSWVVYTDDYQKKVERLLRACHAGMENDVGYDHLITATPNHKDGWRYYQWLIEGPFRAFSDTISLNFLEPGNIETSYFLVDNLEAWPANVLYNFCIASRVPLEHKHLLARWNKFVGVGMDKGLAYLVSSKIGPNQAWTEKIEPNLKEADVEGLWSFIPSLHNYADRHLWTDVTVNWTRLIHGDLDMSKVRENYKAYPSHTKPSNVIWGAIGPTDFEPMKNKSMEELHKLFDLPINKFDPNAPVVVPKKPKAKKVQIEQFVVNHLDPAHVGIGGHQHPPPILQNNLEWLNNAVNNLQVNNQGPAVLPNAVPIMPHWVVEPGAVVQWGAEPHPPHEPVVEHWDNGQANDQPDVDVDFDFDEFIEPEGA